MSKKFNPRTFLPECWAEMVKCCCCYCLRADCAGVGASVWTPEEQMAVENLSLYLEKRSPLLQNDCAPELKQSLNVSVNRERLLALNLLSSSERVTQRREAAERVVSLSHMMLAKGVSLPLDMAETLVRLLQTLDFQVQCQTSLVISNYASAPDETCKALNLRVLRSGGVIPSLLPLLTSRSLEVRWHSTGAITALTQLPPKGGAVTLAEETTVVRNHLLTLGVVPSLLELLQPPHEAVMVNNVVGALLNLSHFENGRSQIVLSGGVPVLVNSMRYLLDECLPHGSSSTDSSVSSPSTGSDSGKAGVIEDLSLFYSVATLTNLCVSRHYRTMIVGVGGFDAIEHLVDILDSFNSTSDEVVKQACVLLRNLAIETDHQLLLVKRGLLTSMENLFAHLCRQLAKHSPAASLRHVKIFEASLKTLAEALNCLENLSLHPHCREALANQNKLVDELLRILKMRCAASSRGGAFNVISRLVESRLLDADSFAANVQDALCVFALEKLEENAKPEEAVEVLLLLNGYFSGLDEFTKNSLRGTDARLALKRIVKLRLEDATESSIRIYKEFLDKN